MTAAAGSIDLGPVVLWGLVMLAIATAVVVLVARAAWHAGRHRRPPP